MSELYICQNCLETTRDYAKSIKELNTNGKCPTCDSEAVFPMAKIAKLAEAAEGARPKQSLMGTTAWKRGYANLVSFLERNGFSGESQWWDGWSADFIFETPRNNQETLAILLRRVDGEAKTIFVSIEKEKPCPTDTGDLA